MSISDILLLLDKFEDELYWFIPELCNKIRKMKLTKSIVLADAIANSVVVGTKKGNEVNQAWRKKIMDEIFILENKPDEEETVFNKLGNQHSKDKFEPQNLFNRLRSM